MTQMIINFNEEGSWCLAGAQFRAKDCQEYFDKMKKGENENEN